MRHDNERGMRWAAAFNPTQSGADGNPQILMDPNWVEEYDRTETLIVEVSGTVADDACVTQSLYYEGGRTPGARASLGRRWRLTASSTSFPRQYRICCM